MKIKFENNMSRPPGFLSEWIRYALQLGSRISLPKISGQLRMAGLRAPIEIIRDGWGVPHIYAANDTDVFFGQGFVHAQDRLFQMEYSRRLASGRLAEIFGRRALPVDRWMRTLTLRRIAEHEASHLDEQTAQMLQAYANGVNAFLARRWRPIEFIILGIRPEPWVIADTLSWVKMMAWSLSVNWEAELLRARAIARLGPEAASELEPPHLKRWPYIIPPGSDYSNIGDWALERARKSRPFSGPSPYQGLGSNNWAVSGTLTADGRTIFANDMHLALTAPAIWYENHIVSDRINAIGVTMPGVPGVISGHNGMVAWGYTNGFVDVQDLYLEKLRRSPEGAVQVEYKDEWENAIVLKEKILVKGGSIETEEVIITRHGPIINNLAPDFVGEQPLALRWTSLDPDPSVNGYYSLLTAADCAEFHEALKHWFGPVVNIISADMAGNIAYTLAGKIPVRARGNGRVPVPGWTDEYEWIGYLPFDTLPHLNNPAQGYIATANNRVTAEDYPVRIELEPISGDRAQRISELILDSSLRGDEKITVDYFRRMQFDQVSPSARWFGRYLNSIIERQSAHTPRSELIDVLDLMKDWDGTLSSNGPPPVIYQVFIRKLAELLLTHKLKESPGEPRHGSLTERFMGKGPTPVIADRGLFGERWLPWLIDILQASDAAWFDLGSGESRDAVVKQALLQAFQELKQTLGSDPTRWSWGRLHKATFHHILGTRPYFCRLFNRGPYPIGGDSTTIWATGTSYHNLDTENMVGPGYRMIINFLDLDQSISLLAPGQSGNPGSRHYSDQVKGWFTGGYHPMLYSRKSILAGSQHILRISP